MAQLDVTNHQIPWNTLQVETNRSGRLDDLFENSGSWFFLFSPYDPYKTLSTITSSPDHWFSLQRPTTDMADAPWTHKSSGCPSGSTSPPTSHQTQTATSSTQDTKGKHILVNWQDNPNYSLITQAQTRERMSKIPSRKSKYYSKQESWVSTGNANNTSQ